MTYTTNKQSRPICLFEQKTREARCATEIMRFKPIVKRRQEKYPNTKYVVNLCCWNAAMSTRLKKATKIATNLFRISSSPPPKVSI